MSVNCKPQWRNLSASTSNDTFNQTCFVKPGERCLFHSRDNHMIEPPTDYIFKFAVNQLCSTWTNSFHLRFKQKNTGYNFKTSSEMSALLYISVSVDYHLGALTLDCPFNRSRARLFTCFPITKGRPWVLSPYDKKSITIECGSSGECKDVLPTSLLSVVNTFQLVWIINWEYTVLKLLIGDVLI